MAEVYLALSGELPGFRTLLVVKRILPHLAQNRQFIRMFLDEARLAALLDHPNVVRIIEVGHDGEEYFLAMELVQGKPLSAVLRKAAREKRPPSPALAAYIMAQAASGLGYAHALTDGEDFELLFAVSPADGARLLEEQPLGEVPLTHIGECVPHGLWVEDPQRLSLAARDRPGRAELDARR